MRIINGSHKRKHITVPKRLTVRPTTDFAKESIFNVMNNYFDFTKVIVIDLFAGTGNISYEFCSRGAKKVISIDNNHLCIRNIKKNAESLQFIQLLAHQQDAFAFLEKYQEKVDIIFADPPYELENITQIPEMVFQNNLLLKNGWLIVEHSKYIDFSNYMYFKEKRIYGNVNFSIFCQ